jgi:hypothetical protein
VLIWNVFETFTRATWKIDELIDYGARGVGEFLIMEADTLMSF